jgi:hypothetical protein
MCFRTWSVVADARHGRRPLATDLYAAGSKLHTNGGLRLQAELIAREAAEQVGLSDTGIPNQHHLEQVVIAASKRWRNTTISANCPHRRLHD